MLYSKIKKEARCLKNSGSGLAISHFKKIVGNSLFFTIGKFLGEK
jgi:hypothetical protein